MNEIVDTPQSPSSPRAPGRARRWLRRSVVAVVAVGLFAGIGLTAIAHGHGFGRWHRGGFMDGVDPARVDEHLDRMLKHVYVEVDATEAQKQSLAPIVKNAVRDLLPLREKMRDTRQQVVALLSQANVDRAALEALRASRLELVEDASRVMTKALADAADVLTPEQRAKLAEHVGRWRGRHG
jgi:Spy/CpxP family protein refolding chaperone